MTWGLKIEAKFRTFSQNVQSMEERINCVSDAESLFLWDSDSDLR